VCPDQKIEVKVNPANLSHYSKLFPGVRVRETLMVSPGMLHPGTKSRVLFSCDSCGSDRSVPFLDYLKYGYKLPAYTCRKCKLKSNLIDKYGVENVFQLDSVKTKIAETNLSRYGVENVSGLDSTKKKRVATNLQKRGVEWPQQSTVVRSKTIDTNLSRHGVENVSSLDWVKRARVETNIEKNGYPYAIVDPAVRETTIQKNLNTFGVTHSIMRMDVRESIARTNTEKYGHAIASRSTEVREKISTRVAATLNRRTMDTVPGIRLIDSKQRIFVIDCPTCGDTFEIGWALFYKRRETRTTICTICNPVDRQQSGLEVQLADFIEKTLGIKVERCVKVGGKEVDILVNSARLAFEFNGVYWHSDLYRPRMYHREKTITCRSVGIGLLHVWEDDWLYRRDIVESMIRVRLGMATKTYQARKCEVVVDKDKTSVSKFLAENHLLGSCVFSKSVSLVFSGEIISCMTFVKRTKGWEMNRFCNALNTVVTGGASRLLTHFRRIAPDFIYTFSDNCYSEGALYEKLGFNKVSELDPDYSFLSGGVRVHKFNFRGRDTTGIPRVYDAGKVKWAIE